MIVLVVGTIGSGKGVVTEYFSKRGFSRFSFGDVVREESRQRGTPETRENLQNLGHELRDILAERIISEIDSKGDSVVDGARYYFQIKNFFDHFGRNSVKVVGVNAWYFLRGLRLMARGREGDPTSWAQFREQNGRDLYGYLAENGQNTASCMNQLDYPLHNNFTIGWLEKKVERVIGEICRTRTD